MAGEERRQERFSAAGGAVEEAASGEGDWRLGVYRSVPHGVVEEFQEGGLCAGEAAEEGCEGRLGLGLGLGLGIQGGGG